RLGGDGDLAGDLGAGPAGVHAARQGRDPDRARHVAVAWGCTARTRGRADPHGPAGVTGKSSVNVVPAPHRDFTSMVPPCSWMRPSVTESPIPVPVRLVV